MPITRNSDGDLVAGLVLRKRLGKRGFGVDGVAVEFRDDVTRLDAGGFGREPGTTCVTTAPDFSVVPSCAATVGVSGT